MGVGVYINISLKGYRVLKRVEREWGMVVWGCFYFILQMGEILCERGVSEAFLEVSLK